MRHLFLTATILTAAAPALAEDSFPATLAGHTFVPAMTMTAPPADAPRDAWVSGKFTGEAPNRQPMTRPGDTGAAYGSHPTGISLPFLGQPIQGFSGFAMNRAEDGAVYVLIDNGFGSKANSPDALLMFNRMTPDFESGKVAITETVFLHDPDHKVPFRIAYEGSDSRYLTGADFDPESIQVLNDEVWIGDEFGPWLIRAGLDGRIIDVYPTLIDGQPLRSPDHPALRIPATAGTDYQSQRSGGYEGMALQPGTNLLWAMLEKPLLAEGGEPEGNFLRVLIFDPAAGEWTGETARFALAEGATAIGDFNFIDNTRALVIERDNGEGDPSLKCQGEPAQDCYPNPALHKRIVLVDTADRDADGFMRRIGHIDLMNIADPDGLARLDTSRMGDGPFTFPFFTIENVMAVSNTQIMVANDNNLPFSAGRKLGEAAQNEFILLDVPEFLAAR
ncbi:MAG: esterase-like activity of phytase family protein [Paracoccus sp. (in: a-proteobacteria)]|uniref:esterase-like activity of phytase family protein n=1 Tax=Paracoccus sp. TaxID=267 RepID=UPI0026E0D40D|nr:esterase-like activity of phytase family protein [Paracoccus sp. (in: a-proteobacteria)]MDO5632423.1 esterase-like activity of phytase family protein [Paracoccus sp. (in: a-proteobacteria)]